jgi:hypothetical protein
MAMFSDIKYSNSKAAYVSKLDQTHFHKITRKHAFIKLLWQFKKKKEKKKLTRWQR